LVPFQTVEEGKSKRGEPRADRRKASGGSLGKAERQKREDERRVKKNKCQQAGSLKTHLKIELEALDVIGEEITEVQITIRAS